MTERYSTHDYPLVKLPHPFLTAYRVHNVGQNSPPKLALALEEQPKKGRTPPEQLHSQDLTWLDITKRSEKESPPLSNNTAWARAYRSPETTFEWQSNKTATLAQIWNVVHA